MSRIKKITAALALAGGVALGVAVPASACACDPPGYKTCARNWEMDPGYVSITANRHATCRAARALGNSWLDTSTWSPGTLNAAGKRWTKTWSKKYGRWSRTIVYRTGRAEVTLYWFKYGAG
jgi:hypothetical protein